MHSILASIWCSSKRPGYQEVLHISLPPSIVKAHNSCYCCWALAAALCHAGHWLQQSVMQGIGCSTVCKVLCIKQTVFSGAAAMAHIVQEG